MSRLNEVLWHRYRELGDLTARVQLLDSYLGLVHHTAHEMRRHRPGAPELEDLIGAGTVGLVQALEGFDPLRGLAFSTYAMPRIRGAILDEINAQDWAPRSVRVRRKLLAQARAELQQKLGGAPTESQVAERMGVPMPTFWKWVGEIEGRSMVALDHAPRGGEDDALHELVPDDRAAAPGDELIRRQHEAPQQFAVFRLRAGRLAAVEAVNSAKDYMTGRKLLESGGAVRSERLADPAAGLKDLLG